MFQFFKRVVLISALIVVTSCTRFCGARLSDLPPEIVVETYLNVSLNLKSTKDKQNLLELTTGKLNESIAAASEDTLKQAFIDRKYEVISYAVIERKDRTPRETEITFRLKYKDLSSAANSAEAPVVTTENTVSVIREKGAWLLRDVIGAKTNLDFAVSKDSEVRGSATNPQPYGPSDDMPVDIEEQENDETD